MSIGKPLSHSLVVGGAALCLVAGLAARASADRGEDVTPASRWKRSPTSEVGLLKSGFAFVTAIPYLGGYYYFFQKGPRLVRCAERLGDDGDQASGRRPLLGMPGLRCRGPSRATAARDAGSLSSE
jgi:hypothetical protein